MIKAIIFDLDDTLISEVDYIKSGYNHIALLLSKKIDKDVHTIFNMLLDLFIASPQNVFNRLFDKLQISYTENDIMKLVQDYRNHIPNIQFYDDVLPCLEIFKTRSIKTGIITDGYISTQRNKLKVLEAHKYFDHIILTDELGREYWKPHQKAFELMSDMLGVEFNEMMYVGDNPEKDFYISSIYPLKTVRINRNGNIYKDKKYLNGIEEDYGIMCLEELFVITSISL